MTYKNPKKWAAALDAHLTKTLGGDFTTKVRPNGPPSRLYSTRWVAPAGEDPTLFEDRARVAIADFYQENPAPVSR